MRELAFTVLGEPVPCARARVVRNHRPDGSTVIKGITPARTRGYERLVADQARLHANRARWCPPEHALASFELLVDVYRLRRVGDWDNYGKAIADALTAAGVWRDDRYVHDARVRLFVDLRAPRVEIRVRVLE
jgi:Holliday junction resolvase RusA-like endonuclease